MIINCHIVTTRSDADDNCIRLLWRFWHANLGPIFMWHALFFPSDFGHKLIILQGNFDNWQIYKMCLNSFFIESIIYLSKRQSFFFFFFFVITSVRNRVQFVNSQDVEELLFHCAGIVCLDHCIKDISHCLV